MNPVTVIDRPSIKTARCTVTYRDITAFFNTHLRDELSPVRYAQIESLAKDIELPQAYGVFHDEDHYIKTLKLLLMSTNETRRRKYFFLKHIFPMLSCHHNLLDVGVGDGDLTYTLARRFQRVTLVDINDDILHKAQFRYFQHCIQVNKTTASILHVDLMQSYYDLAVISHVLYYVDPSDWLAVVKRVFLSLKPGGVLVMVLNGDQDKESLAQHFNGKSLAIHDFVNQCALELRIPVQVYASTECFCSQTLLPMMHMVGVHLYDIGSQCSEATLVDYLNQYHYRQGIYQFSTDQNFIVLQK